MGMRLNSAQQFVVLTRLRVDSAHDYARQIADVCVETI